MFSFHACAKKRSLATHSDDVFSAANSDFAEKEAHRYCTEEVVGGDPWGIRWGSAGDPRRIHAVKWGIHNFCHARGLGFEGDPVEPLNAFIILQREVRVGEETKLVGKFDSRILHTW